MFNSAGTETIVWRKTKKDQCIDSFVFPITATPNLGNRGLGGEVDFQICIAKFFSLFLHFHLHLHPVSRCVSSRLALDSSGLIDGE